MTRTIILCSVLAASLVLVTSAQARHASNPILYVNFSTGGSISVTTGDGTVVGTPSGAATVIPAGYYTLQYVFGDCEVQPQFQLTGPGVDVVTDVNTGVVIQPSDVDFLPESTYSWSDPATPSVVYQFSTSSQVVGSPPAPTTIPKAKPGATVSSQDIVGSDSSQGAGSALPPSVRLLSATIDANGKITLLQAGKPPSKLEPGRYMFTVINHDPRSGFAIEQPASHTVALARGAFSGKRSVSVSLTAGTWIFIATPGKATSSFVVQ